MASCEQNSYFNQRIIRSHIPTNKSSESKTKSSNHDHSFRCPPSPFSGTPARPPPPQNPDTREQNSYIKPRPQIISENKTKSINHDHSFRCPPPPFSGIPAPPPPPQLDPDTPHAVDQQRSGDAGALEEEPSDETEELSDVIEEKMLKVRSGLNMGISTNMKAKKGLVGHRSDDDDAGRGLQLRIFDGKSKLSIFIDCDSLLVDGSNIAVIVKLSFNQLMAHYTSRRNRVARRVLSQVQSFVQEYDQHDDMITQFWKCCLCEEKFSDSAAHFLHVECHHLAVLCVDTQWSSMIEGGAWKAIDATKAMLLLQDLFEKEDLSEEWARKYLLEESWPLSDDSQQQRILAEIHNFLQLLLSEKLLTWVHLEEIAEYSVNELECVFPTCSTLKHLGPILAQTHLCICFLGVSQLETILIFLKSIKIASLHPEEKMASSHTEKEEISTPAPKEVIFLEGDMIRIRISHDTLRGLITSETYADMGNHQDRLNTHTGALHRWILEGVWSQEQLNVWNSRILENKVRAASSLLEHESKTMSLLMETREDIDLQFTERDALLVQTFMGMENWILRTINPAAAVDCREVLLALVKSYLQAFLEDDGFRKGVKEATLLNHVLSSKSTTWLSKEVLKAGSGKSYNLPRGLIEENMQSGLNLGISFNRKARKRLAGSGKSYKLWRNIY